MKKTFTLMTAVGLLSLLPCVSPAGEKEDQENRLEQDKIAQETNARRQTELFRRGQQEKADGAIVASVTDGRVHIVVNVAASVGVDAASLASEMGQIVGGRGGGKPTMAQAGGNVPDEIPNAFAAAKKALG